MYDMFTESPTSRVAYLSDYEVLCRSCALREYMDLGGELSHLERLKPHEEDQEIKRRTGLEAWNRWEADRAFSENGGLVCDWCGLILVDYVPPEDDEEDQ